MKFTAFVEMWKASARGVKTSKSWARAQDQVLEAHVLPILGAMDLIKIRPEDISKVIEASVSKGHAPNTTKKIYMVLSKVFADAVEFFEYIQKTPVKRRYHQPFIPPVKRAYETMERALVVLEYVYSHPLYGLPVWIMTLAGLRISEVEALTWDSIDFDLEVINVVASYCTTGKEIRPYTKNKNQHVVPMAPMLRAYLWNRRKQSGFVCKNTTGGMMSRWSLRKFLNKLQETLSLKIRSSHGLRHTCARIVVEKGASDEEIMQLLGHKWLASSKTYTHREGTVGLKKVVDRIVDLKPKKRKKKKAA